MDSKTVREYMLAHTSKDSKIVQDLIKTSENELEYTDMISGRLVGGLLSMLIKISGAKRVLEVGTFTGYSALTMAEALPLDGVLYTCEYNQRYEKIARSFFRKGRFDSIIHLVMGRALDTIPTINGLFDFVFLDADKINYPAYYELILPRLDQSGIMVIDNVLWDKEVLNPISEKAKAIDTLNNIIDNDRSVEQLMLPVRDGITIVHKKSLNSKS